VNGSWVPFPLYVAHRYLRSTRRDAFVTFLSLTAAAGIALGVAALILSSSALSGFQTVLRDEILVRTPHIEVTLPGGADLEGLMTEVAAVPGVVSAQPWIRGRGWLMAGGRAQPVEIVGFEDSLPEQFPGLSDRRPGLYVSDRLQKNWGLATGEMAEVISARPTLTPFGPQPRVKRLAIAGAYAAGRTEQDERVAIPLADAIPLFGQENQRLVVACADLGEAMGVAERLEVLLPPGSIASTWRDQNKALFFLLRLEKSLMFVAVFLIVVVAAMAVISDLMLILAHKQAEIGMLGAMGSRPESLRQILLWLGGLLVGIGASVGTLLGIGGAIVLDRYRLLSLPGDVYFLDHVPFLIRPQEVLVILISTLSLALLCSWFAASRAATLRPVEALRR